MKIVNGMEFVNDNRAIGKWEFFDRINSMDEFDEKNPLNPNPEYDFKEVYFLPQGKGYWIFEGWTSGVLVIHYGGYDPLLEYKFEIKNISSKLYMFIFVENEDEKYINVLTKVSDKEYTVADIKRTENIDLPFVSDEKIIGEWETVGYVQKIDDFDGTNDPNQRLWLESAKFMADGTVKRKYFDAEWTDKWTKGFLLDQKKSVLSAYSFKVIGGNEYMFLEWKMGNYVYGGMPATYYVFKKV